MLNKKRVNPINNTNESEYRIISPNSMIMQVFESNSSINAEEKPIKRNQSNSDKLYEEILQTIENWNYEDIVSIYNDHFSRENIFHCAFTTSMKTNLATIFWDSLDNCNFLHYAALYRATKIVIYLLTNKYNFHIDSVTEEGITALHISAALGDFFTVRELLLKGANKNILDKKGRTALHYAVYTNIETCIILTNDNEFDIQLQDEDEKSVLDYIKITNKPFIYEYFDCFNKKSNHLWIPRNIYQFECISIIPKADNNNQCVCGQKINEHHSIFERYDLTENEEVEKPTNVYGEIEFYNLYQSKPYVRMSVNTKFEITASLLLEQWKINKPSLIISIYGSDFDGYTIKEILKKGILKSAGNNDTIIWIITNGIATNLIEVIGQAVREFADAYGENQIYAIGLVPWNVNNDTEFLYSENYQGNYPADYHKTKSDNNKTKSIDQNHSHYIFIDIPRNKDWKVSYLDYRLKFENYISKLNEYLTNTKISFEKVPLCGILVSGSREDLKVLHRSMITNEKPCVVIKGSGGLANLIGELFDEINEKKRKKKTIAETLEKENLREMMIEIWNVIDEFEEEIDMIREIIENQHLIEIFAVDEDNPNELDKKILSSLLSEDKHSNKPANYLNVHQLEVAVSINRYDVAKEKIFTDGKKWNNEDLIPLVCKSISENKVEFIKLFVDKGFFLGKVVTVEFLENLYTSDIFNGFKSARILNQGLRLSGFKKNNKTVTLYDIGLVLKYLLGDLYFPLYLRKSFQVTINKNLSLKRPCRELFIWCLLTGRMRMAQIIWALERESIAAALFAANLLRQMKYLTDVIADKDDLDEWADKFETNAEGVVEECFKENPEFTRENLVRELDYYGKSTYLELASDGGSIKFIAHRSCQELLNFVWRNTLDQSTKPNTFVAYLFIGILCPLFIPFFVKFKTLFYRPENEIEEYKKKMKDHKKNVMLDDKHNETMINLKQKLKKRFTSFELKIYFKKIYDFYSTPVIKFSYTISFYLIFILYFTFLNLTGYHVKYLQTSYVYIYIILIIWTISLLIEEFRQAFDSGISLKEYLNDMWNIIDILSHFFFIMGTFAILITLGDSYSKILFFSIMDITPIQAIYIYLIRLAKFLYGFSIFLFTLRILQYFSINVNMGPIIVMIRNMISNDLGPFLAILITVLVSYSILLASVNFEVKPNLSSKEFSIIIYEMLRIAYFQLFGDLRMDILRGENKLTQCTMNNIMCPDIWGIWLGPIITAIYMVMSNVLMLNLLVAIFSNTYEIIQSSATQYWTLERYQLMRQSSSRPPIAPPLIIFWQIYFLFTKIFSIKIKTNNPFRISYDNLPNKEKQLIQWERMRANDFIRSSDEESKSNRTKTTLIVNRGAGSLNSFEGIKKDFDLIKNEIQQNFQEKVTTVEIRLEKLDIISENVKIIYEILERLGINKSNKHKFKIFKEADNYGDVSSRCIDNRNDMDDELRKTSLLDDDDDNSTKLSYCLIENHIILRLVPIVNFNRILKMEFINENEMESIDKQKFKDEIKAYNVAPVNPHETLSQFGKSLLPFWGINHCVHIMISRFIDSENISNKSQLQVAAIRRNASIELPFIIVQHNSLCLLNSCANNSLKSIAKQYLNFICNRRQENSSKQNNFELLNSVELDEIYRGYVKDFRNTNNSWMETTAYNIHQAEIDKFSEDFWMLEQDEFEETCWININNELWTNPSNKDLLSKLSFYLDYTI